MPIAIAITFIGIVLDDWIFDKFTRKEKHSMSEANKELSQEVAVQVEETEKVTFDLEASEEQLLEEFGVLFLAAEYTYAAL